MNHKEFEAVFDFIFCEHPEPSGAVKLKWESMFGKLDKNLFFSAAKQLAKQKTYGPPKTDDMAEAIYQVMRQRMPAALKTSPEAAHPKDNALTQAAWKRAEAIVGSLSEIQFKSPEELDHATRWRETELRRHFRACLAVMQERAKELVRSGKEPQEAISMVSEPIRQLTAAPKVIEITTQLAAKKAV